METKTKDQAGIDLLDAIDTYIMAAIAEHKEMGGNRVSFLYKKRWKNI